MLGNRDESLGPDALTPESASRRGLLCAVLVALLFVAVLLPTLGRDLGYYADESYYDDVAIRMVQTGDYVIPHYLSDGLPHFNKPIVTYWMIAASYKLMGINFFTSRLPSLLAGCLLAWITFRLARVLFRRKESATLATLVLLSNFLIINYSVVSMPDIFQTLFLTASFCGFAAILFNKDHSLLNYALAYVGAGLAVETKGLPGLILVAYVFCFCLLLRQKTGVRCRNLVEWKMLLLGAVVAFSWFVIITIQYKSAAIFGHPHKLDGFLADQIGDELPGKGKAHRLSNVLFYLQSPCSHFAPWLLFLAMALIPDFSLFRNFWREHKAKLLFILCWGALLVLIFSMSKQVRGRYLMPVYPMLAVIVGALLAEIIEKGRSSRWVRKTCKGMLLLMALFGLVIGLVGVWCGTALVVGGLILSIAALAFFLASLRRKDSFCFCGLAASLLIAVSVYTVLVKPAFDVSPLPGITRQLASAGLDGSKVAGVGLPTRAASQINVLSEGRIQIHGTTDKVTFGDVQKYPVILLSQEYRDKWNLEGYQFQPCGCSYREWTAADIRKLLRTRDLDSVMEGRKILYYIATK